MMSGRGKRKQVLQLDSASKLHRYGYSKGFHSKDKKGKGTVLSLVDFSDTDSDDDGDVPEPMTGDVKFDEEDIAAGHAAADVDQPSLAVFPDKVDGSIEEKPSDMDDELKNFLSEIEAIPMPVELNGIEQVNQKDSPDISQESHSEAVQEAPKPTARTGQSNFHYSMFVKGESEFVHSPKQIMEADVENSHPELKEEEIPDEPKTNWHMVQDEQTQYYYYWNIVTNEVTWEIPTEYTQFLLLHREYEEKIARYTPEQLEKLKEKQTKTAVKDSGAKHSNEETLSGHEVQPAETQNSSLSDVQEQDGKPQKITNDAEHVHGAVRAISPSPVLSPRPEASEESRRHKHKKEKRSHHKKKHKRRYEDSVEDRHASKTPDNSQAVVSSESIETTVVTGYKFPSIVPYLSDQDDSDEDDNSPHVPQLGSTTITTVVPDIIEGEEEQLHGTELLELEFSSASGSADAQSLIAKEPSQLDLLSETADAFITSVLLLPPPPPPPKEEEPTIDQIQEDSPDRKNNITTHTDAASLVETSEDPMESSLQTNSDKSLTDLMDGSLVTCHGDGGEISKIVSAVEDPVAKALAEENESNNDLKTDANIVALHVMKESDKIKSVPKEVIDMFAEHFPMPVCSQKEDIASVATSSVNTDNHDTEIVKSLELSEEVMEEGEILETEKETTVNKERHEPSKKNQNNSEKIREREASEQQTLPKSINIVGYASDDEEEEGEVREKVVKKEEKSASHKQRKKDKKKEAKKNRKDKGTESSSSVDNRIDKKVVHKAPAELKTDVPKITSQGASDMKPKITSHSASETKPKIVSQRTSETKPKIASHGAAELKAEIADHGAAEMKTEIVGHGAAEKEPEKTVDDDGDIDFDLDDIDRALEIALEKKLEKKKMEQQTKMEDKENRSQDEVIQSTALGELVHKQPISDATVLPIKSLDTNVPETSTNKDTSTHPVQKPELDSEIITSEEAQANLLADIKEIAELALNKLEFLDISTDNLSRLQVLFIELQTRHTDWMAGGLSTEYFYEQLKIADGLLEQYELSAVPEGWACQWDRANNRYYYRNKVTNRIQWEYPEGESQEKEETQIVNVVNDESVTKVRDRGSDDHRRSKSSGSGRHRKRDEKDKSKRDRRSSSRHYHRKRRKTRDQSNSSNSSAESQQHRRHRKSKKKKHRVERTPSVEIVENSDGMDVVEIIDIPITPVHPSSPAMPQATSDDPAVSTQPDTIDTQDGLDVALDGHPLPPAVDDTDMELTQEVQEENVANAEPPMKEESSEIVNTAVISKPPQIIHPPVITALNPDGYAPGELYSAPQIITSASASSYTSYAVAHPTEQVPSAPETSIETSQDTEKSTKKKKKDKKSLTTGSSIMMKKKHMSSMVQKWQKVQIEVEKEDRAKELRQAAIRKKIEELKNVDKQS